MLRTIRGLTGSSPAAAVERLRAVSPVGFGHGIERCEERSSYGVFVACHFWHGCRVVSSAYLSDQPLIFLTRLLLSFSLVFIQSLFQVECLFLINTKKYCKIFWLTLRLVAVQRKQPVTVMFTDDVRFWHTSRPYLTFLAFLRRCHIMITYFMTILIIVRGLSLPYFLNPSCSTGFCAYNKSRPDLNPLCQVQPNASAKLTKSHPNDQSSN